MSLIKASTKPEKKYHRLRLDISNTLWFAILRRFSSPVEFFRLNLHKWYIENELKDSEAYFIAENELVLRCSEDISTNPKNSIDGIQATEYRTVHIDIVTEIWRALRDDFGDFKTGLNTLLWTWYKQRMLNRGTPVQEKKPDVK